MRQSGRWLCYSFVATWMLKRSMVTFRLLGNLTAANGERVLERELEEPASLEQVVLAHQEEIPDVIRLWKEAECRFTVGDCIAAESPVGEGGDMAHVTLLTTQC